MAEPLELRLPWPPSVNKYWRHERGRTHISPRGLEYRNAVWAAVIESGRRDLPVPGPLEVTIQAHPPDRRKRDLDNLLKALLDALEAARVIRDDAEIDALCVRRKAPIKEGLVVVRVAPIKKPP